MTMNRTDLLYFCKEFLWGITELQQAAHPNGAPKSFEMLLLANGIACGKRIATDLPDLAPKECFKNTFLALTDHPGFVYCEGFALDGDLPIPVHHAWLVNPETLEVIDRTPSWSSKADPLYFGIPVQTNYVFASAAESNGWPSPFFEGEMFNTDLWTLPTADWVQAINRERAIV